MQKPPHVRETSAGRTGPSAPGVGGFPGAEHQFGQRRVFPRTTGARRRYPRLASLCRSALCGTLGLLALGSIAWGEGTEDFPALQFRLNDTLLDVYAGTEIPPESAPARGLTDLRAELKSDAARRVLDTAIQQMAGAPIARQIGMARGILQHVAALEMLQRQTAGKIDEARDWRSLIALPKYANAVDGALLLQQPPEKARQPEISQVLTREYFTWQVMRTRQLLDYFEAGSANGEATDAFIDAASAEVVALASFPVELLQAAGLPATVSQIPPRPAMVAPFDSDASRNALAEWRNSVEGTLPNLLKPEDVTRLERLLVRFVKLVPKEYRNGVNNGHIIIPLEYREARQFTEQAQALINELAPVWRRDRTEAFNQFHQPLHEALEGLSQRIHHIAPPEAVEESAKNAVSVLEDKFQLSSRRAGAKSDVIEETALEVRTALIDSLAAAKADQWEEAESLRLDAYTSFDSEIEARVLPRNYELGSRTERSFLDGSSNEPGIKALLDRRAPIEELTDGYERTLNDLDESVSLLRVSVSPATISFTAFSIVAREGLEAVIVLAALLAGLRGSQNQGTRRWISSGAWLALVASAITFWLSKTLIQSLSRYGEKLEAVVSILAVGILLMVTNWVFHKFYWVGWNAKLRSLSKDAQQTESARWEWLALLGVGFLTVYREGFETTLFMQSLILEGSTWPVVIGVLAAAAFIGIVGFSIFIFGAKLPFRKLLVVTGVLVVSIMVTFLGSTTRLFQTVGWLPIHPVPSLNFPAWAGLWFGLYPSWEGLLIPPLALVYVGGAWLWVRFQSRRAGPPAPQVMEKPVPSLAA